MKVLSNIYNKIMNNKKYLILFIIALGLLSTIIIFLQSGIKKGDDMYFHLSRILSIKDLMKMEAQSFKIYPNYFNGYGYANPLFYPDIFLYIPAVLNYIGINIIWSYKIFLLIISICSIFTMYITINGISKNKYASIIGSIMYAFSSYRLVDMFERAALGETIAFIFAPLVIYGIYEIIYGNYKKFYILTIGMSGLILSHMLSSVMLAVVLMIICIINIKKFIADKKRILYLIVAAIITILLTSYFIFPMLEQMNSNNFLFNDMSKLNSYSLKERAVPFYLTILEIPNFRKGLLNKIWMPSGIGLIYFYMIYTYIRFKDKKDKFINISFIIGITAILLSTNIFPWHLKIVESMLSVIQFPWRFYLIATLFITIGGSILLSKKYTKAKEQIKTIKNIFLLSLISIISMTVISFLPPIVKKVESYDASYGEYIPQLVNQSEIATRGQKVLSDNEINLKYSKNNSITNIEFSENKSDQTILELPLIYYKGYYATINNQEASMFQTKSGLVGIELGDTQEGTIKCYYKGTKITKITKYISIIAVIIFSLYIIKEVKHEK